MKKMGSDKLKWNVVKDRFLAQQAEHNAQINAHTGQKRRPDYGFVALARIGTSADKFDVKRYNREQFLVRTPRVPSPAGRGLCPRHGVNAARRKAAPNALPIFAFAAYAQGTLVASMGARRGAELELPPSLRNQAFFGTDGGDDRSKCLMLQAYVPTKCARTLGTVRLARPARVGAPPGLRRRDRRWIARRRGSARSRRHDHPTRIDGRRRPQHS